MSTPLSQTSIQFGSIPDASELSPTCSPGDIHHHNVTFATPFPNNEVRVIGTGAALDKSGFPPSPAVVCIAQDVKASGFRLKVRNSDTAKGTSNYFWMAVCEKPTIGPDGAPQPPPQLHMGIVQPRAFAQSGDFPHLHWQQWLNVPFSSVFLAKKGAIAVVASSYNMNSSIVAPFFLQNSSQSPASYLHSTPVAVVQDVTPQSFTLSGRNSDVVPGFCAYAWLALAPFSMDRPASPALVIDSGVSSVSKYTLTGTPGDTFRQEIYFSQSFLTPPLVLVLANDGQGRVPDPENVGVVGMAQNITPYGFTLVGRNSDCKADGGSAGFYWVAIGWTAPRAP